MRIISGAGIYVTPSADEITHFDVQLNVPDLTLGTYSLPVGCVDDQTPHSEDEIYMVTAGRARLVTDDGEAWIGPGDVVYVPATEAHRFVDITEDLALVVVFGPAYRSRRREPIAD